MFIPSNTSIYGGVSDQTRPLITLSRVFLGPPLLIMPNGPGSARFYLSPRAGLLHLVGMAGLIAIGGRPNVGKSALFNRLAGRKIAIVHDQPGITRDRISAVSQRASRPFTLWDTGGIFGGGETELTAQVRQAVDEALRDSDLLLFVVDAKQGLSPIDQELARTLRKSRKPAVLVINKIDDDKHEALASEF